MSFILSDCDFRSSFFRFLPRFSFKKSKTFRQVRAFRAACGRTSPEGEKVFPDFPLSASFRERDGRPIEWDIGNFIHGCQRRRTKSA